MQSGTETTALAGRQTLAIDLDLHWKGVCRVKWVVCWNICSATASKKSKKRNDQEGSYKGSCKFQAPSSPRKLWSLDFNTLSSMQLLWLNTTKNNMGRKTVCLAYTSWATAHRGKPRQESGQETGSRNWRRGHGWTLSIGLFIHNLLSLLAYTYPSMTPPTVRWALPHQS